MSRLGLRALLQATCEAWDQVEGPSLGAAVLALVLRAPFIVVVVVGAAVAAGLRALGWS